MNLPKHSASLIGVAVLAFLSLFFRFGMRGYDYISYTFAFFALLTLVLHFAGPGLRRAVIILTSLGLIYFCLVEIPIIKNSRTDPEPGRDYLVVLGAAVHGDVPSLALTHRLEGALEYMQAYPDSVAILSGGQGDGENISEAQCMQDWLFTRGIPMERLIIEDRSTSTAENLKNSFAIIRELGGDPDGNVAIVSSSYHLYRAKTMARFLDVEAVGVAGSPGFPIFTLSCYIREAFGVTHLLVFGL